MCMWLRAMCATACQSGTQASMRATRTCCSAWRSGQRSSRNCHADVARVLRPGGVVVYTARTTADAHYGTGIPRGDGMYEHGGFIVHFFDPGLIDRLSAPFGGVAEQRAFEEGDLPRRLVLVTMHKAA